MVRLPIPGQDSGTWGDILNEYLSQTLKSDGTIKDSAVTSNTLAPNSVTNSALASNSVNAVTIADGSISEALLDAALQVKVNASGGTPDWSTITNKPTVIAAGADAAAARTAIGAGTSSLVIGTTSTTAKAGDYAPTQADVGLSNVDNTSDANKPISTATQTALDAKAATIHVHTIGDITATGTASASTYLRGDGSWVTPPVGGDASTNTATSVDGEVALFSSTGGKTLKRASGTGIATLTAGVLGTATAPSGTIVGTTDTQALTNKTLTGSVLSGTTILPQAAQFIHYNTVDQVTNYERVQQYWNSNTYTMITESGGTGTLRDIAILSGSNGYTLSNTGTKNKINGTSAGAGSISLNVTGSLAASSGVQYGLSVAPTIGQSSTAGYTALLINPTETTTGSGSKMLADFQVGGTSKLSINNSGQILAGDYALATEIAHFKGGSGGTPILKLSRGSGSTPSNIFDFSLAGGGFTIRDITGGGNGWIASNMFAASTYAQVYIGQANSQSDQSARPATLSAGTHASPAGTDVAGPILQISGGGGNGAGAPGDIRFMTYNTTTSGTTPQSATTKVTLSGSTGVLTIATPGTVSGSVVSIDGTQTLTNKTLTTPKIAKINDTNGNTVFETTTVASAVNYVGVANSTNSPIIYATGASTDVGFFLDSKGNGSHTMRDGSGNIRVQFFGGGANYFQFNAAAAASTPQITMTGSDTNVGLTIVTKGSGRFTVYAPSGQTPTISGSGVDTNHDLNLVTKGTGVVQANGVPIITASSTATLTNKTINFANNTVTGVPYDLSIVGFGMVSTRAVGTGDFPFGVRLQRACTLTSVTYRCQTADVSGDLIVELRKNGVAVSGSSATIASGSQVSGGTATGSWSFALGDIVTVYVTAVGTTPGVGLTADITGVTA